MLEAVISIVIVTVGMVAVLSGLAVAVASTGTVQLDTIARQQATETLESIYTARQTSQISFAAINNTTANPPGLFVPGWQPIWNPGPDGLNGTGDDVPPTNNPLYVPGPSGILTGASPPDVLVDLSKFQRQITINNIPSEPNVRQVVVQVQYSTPGGLQRTYSVQCLISSFR
jgi:hypothetical protein